MYSRSYNSSNRVPPNYNGTSIKPEPVPEEIIEETAAEIETEEEEVIDIFAEQRYARVPLMEIPKYKQPAPIAEKPKPQPPVKIEKPPEKCPEPLKTPPKPPMRKICADDILLIGLLIILLGCENVDLKLILAVAVLLFAGF